MSGSSEAEEATQFTLLTECLGAALQDSGSNISLPDEVVAQFKSGTVQDDSSIRDFNKLFGSSDHTNRLRLDHGAFINVVAILLHLPYSHYQERLLFAFTHTIDLFKTPLATQDTLKRAGHVPASVAEIQIKYRKINSKLIHKMMQVLVLEEQERSMRLMAGHILFALIHGSLEAQDIARKYPEIAKLGPLVDKDDNYILRIFTANIIREMCDTTSEPHHFWPQISKRKKTKHEDFPLAQMPDSAWLSAAADYLSSKDVGRGFHGDSQPVVSKLLSISTGTRAFDDSPRANILAVVNDKFIFIIPGTPKRPLAALELLLDSRCKCFIKARTSPDKLSDVCDGVDVHMDTAGKGYQVFEGTRSALDIAILTLPQYEQGETFAVHASQSLKLLPPLLRNEERPADTEISSHTASRSFRRLNVGMIDISRESDSEEDVFSASDPGSILGMDAHTSRRKLSRSRSRQSSRKTEAKLKEARREKPSEPTTSPPQGSLRCGERQEFPTQSWSIDPRMLTRRKSDDMQADATAGVGMNMDFENYVEQSKTQAEKEPGRRAKAPQPSAGPRQNTIPTQRVESSPSNRVYRLPLKRSLEAARGTIDRGHSRQSLEPERSLAQRSSNKEMSEHHKPLQPRTRNVDLEPTEVPGKTPAANNNNSTTQPKKAQTALRRSAKSRTESASPMDWDKGDMADESNCLPTAKKPRLTKATPKPAPRQSQGKTPAQEEKMQLNDSGATSMLKRPKATSTKIQKPQQTNFQAKHDDFELEDDEEPAAPASNGGRATTKRAANVATKNLNSKMPNPTKGLSATSATKGRKVLQPRDTNTSLASNRARRSQPKSKKYIDESDSGSEDPNKEGEDIPEKKTSDTTTYKQTSVTEYELQKSAILAPRPRQTAGVSPRPIGTEEPNEAQSDHEVYTAPDIPIRRVTKTTEIAAAYETLVTASPTRLDEAMTRAVREERDGAPELREAKQQNTQLQETSTGAAGYDSPNETAEDSYSKNPTKSQGPRDSFGSKLGQLIQKAAPQGMNAMASHATLLSNAKSFVGSVNETRITSPKKPRPSTTASISKNGDAEVLQRAGTSTKRKEKAAAGKGIAPIAQEKKQAAASSNENAKITTKASKASPSPLTVAQRTQRAELSDSKKVTTKETSTSYAGSTSSRKAPAPVTPSAPQEKAELNESVSGQEDVGALREDGQGHAIQSATQLRDTNMTVDLTQDSDEAISVSGQDDTNHVEDGLGGIENEAVTKAHITREPDNDDISLIRHGEQASQQPTRSARAKLCTPESSTLTKTPQNPKLLSAAGIARTSDLAASKSEAPISRGSTIKKSQLVHFDTRGPQNQGISSPDKQTRKSAAAPSDTPEAKKNMTYKQSRFAAARRNPFVQVPTLQADPADSAGEVGDDGSGIIVENDTIMEDVGEAVQEGRENPVSEESAFALTRHLPPQGSQSSRVDQNGSPRLPPPHLNRSTHHEDSDMNGIAGIADKHDNVENEDLTASAEDSASESEELASQDSDQSFHLTTEAHLNRQFDKSIRSPKKASTTAVSPPKAVKQVERRPASATMRVNSMPRESLGLSRLVQEQYPEAQKVVVTDSFKKPALRTAVSKALNVSTKIPMVDHKAPAQASGANRQPLKEVSINYKKTTVPEESSPNHTTEFSSAAPIRITKPQSKTPVQPHAASESLRETPGSLMTILLVDHADRKVKEEDTILENLNRGKSAYRATKDADRTLVEDDSIQPFRGRQPPDVISVSSPPGAEPDTYSRQDDVHWRNGAREAQRGIQDALLEITDTVLIRLENEEKVIERKVLNYDAGCGNILNQFRARQTRSIQHARQLVLERAAAGSAKVHATFSRLQERKRNVRSRDAKDLVQRAVKEKENALTEQIEQMLKKQQKRGTDAGELAEQGESEDQSVNDDLKLKDL